MKKLLVLLLVTGAMLSASAQITTTTKTTTHHYRYYYYPASNIYYDETSGSYWYWDNGTSSWTMAQSLPSNVKIVKASRYPVMYTGDDPWKNNATDMKKFKVKKNGKVKIKPERSR